GQMEFTDPSLALNPLRTIDSVLRELLRRTRPRRSAAERETALNDLLESVALTPELARRRPGHLSGGQRQRAAIARALAVDPEVLVADEPTSALDVSVQAEILELLDELARRQGLAIVLITHDLRVVERLADEVIVLEQGRVQEQGAVADVLRRPTSAYTRALIDAVPRLDGGAHR
ncbi:ATP-binding cassette domain-containing protein, partial [Microbacterium sp. SCN 71-21]|uniref:ATP-binding cassette domain-containing protein n=1 Tax=Microbacterium sp. SCN 71-21 TaxID=1660116 RepID=UPI000ABDAFD7